MRRDCTRAACYDARLFHKHIAISAVVLGVLGGCSGEDGPPGPAGIGGMGEPGAPGMDGDPAADAPSISSVTPLEVFLGSTVDVAITGHETSWAAITEADVSFGQGIRILSVANASRTSLVARVEVDLDAEVDTPRTVSVGELEFVQAFRARTSLELELIDGGGVAAQGAIQRVRVHQRDLSQPFEGDPLITAAGSSGHTTEFRGLYTLDLLMRYDVDAALGPTDIVIQSNSGTAVARDAVNVVVTTPLDLSEGTNAATMPEPGASLLYRFIPQSGVTVDVTLANTPIDTENEVYVLNDGSFEGLFGPPSAFPNFGTDEIYVVVSNRSADAGFSFDVELSYAPFPTLVPGVPTVAPLVSQGDVYQIDLASGQTLDVQIDEVLAGGCMFGFADTYVEILNPAGMVVAANNDISIDNFCSQVEWQATTAGAHFVRVLPGPMAFLDFDPSYMITAALL